MTLQVTVENLSSIQRKLTISLLAEVIDTEMQQRLQKLSAKIKLPGFRPGKVPFDLIKSRYQNAVHDEVVSDKIKESYLAALEQENIKPVGMPKIDIVAAKPQEDFVYTALVEIYPEVKVGDLGQISVEKLDATVGEEDVDAMLEKMRKQNAEWIEVVDNSQRKIQRGDKVIVDFTVKIHAEQAKEESEKDVKFEIGGGEMWPEFETPLIGHSVGEEVAFTLTFPETHVDKSVVGKTADFQVKIKQLWEAKLPEIDDAFAAKHGVKEGGAEVLRANVRKRLEEELHNILQRHLNDSIVDKLIELNPFEVPQSLVEAEITRKQEQMQNEFRMMFGKDKKPMEIPRQYFAEVAKKNVSTGIIFSELATANNVKVTPEQVRANVESKAVAYGKPEDVVNWFYADENRLKHIEAELLEKAIFDYIQQHIKITNKTIGYKEAVALNK